MTYVAKPQSYNFFFNDGCEWLNFYVGEWTLRQRYREQLAYHGKNPHAVLPSFNKLLQSLQHSNVRAVFLVALNY